MISVVSVCSICKVLPMKHWRRSVLRLVLLAVEVFQCTYPKISFPVTYVHDNCKLFLATRLFLNLKLSICDGLIGSHNFSV